MLRKTKELRHAKLSARDGKIGHLEDFYFDDQTWTMRYLAADTGDWLPQRKVLISPFAVAAIHLERHKAIEVNLTKKQIKDSPSIETHKPVSRQFEAEYFQYYGWPYYWPGPLLWGPLEAPGAFIPSAFPPEPHPRQAPEGPDAHLRSVFEIIGFNGYQVQALDEVFGHIEEFIFDDQTWSIRYLVADRRHWLPAKRALLAPQWISWVSWPEARVYIDLDKETVRRAPEYEPSKPITREYEEKLFTHYTRQPYWEMQGASKSSQEKQKAERGNF
ncbi:MAG TPA: PRC-barrel domain-containing protein [Verrucomicrobiae bacterium]|nr:PRC-barrel domain-containing protein [Verrucomicrobiae bacterium]